MARQASAHHPPNQDILARLRLNDHTRTDWAFSAEGSLLLYDPAVLGKRAFDQFFGMQTVAASALGWMTAGGLRPDLGLVAAPEHWCHLSRAAAADKVAALVRFGWMQAITVLPLHIAANGADIRIRPSGLTPDERLQHRADHRPMKGRNPEPYSAWIRCTKGRLALTWTFFLGFTSKQKATMFGPGHTIEFPWPKGIYHAKGWSFEAREDEDGLSKDQYVLQLATLTETEAAYVG